MARLLSILLGVAVILSLSSTIFAATYSGGSGTPEDPYRIATAANWQMMANSPNDWSKYFILTADIDLSGVTLTPIAQDINCDDEYLFQGIQFSGVFNGNGHKIVNAVIDLPECDFVGLFGRISSDGIIHNIIIENALILGRHYVGSIAGLTSGSITSCYVYSTVSGGSYVGDLAGVNVLGTIQSCYVSGSAIGKYKIGGLAGSNDRGTILDCSTLADISATDCCVGGIVGDNSSGTISQSCSTGTFSGNYLVGGLVGYNYGTITSCYATGTVNGINDNVGGLVGGNERGEITSCYATATVLGRSYLGGLCGYNNFYGTVQNCYASGMLSSNDYAGGLVGQNQGTIDSCYAIGKVDGTGNHVGGLVGFTNIIITSSFWDKETSAQTTSDGGMGKTTSQMKTLSTFTDLEWDFATVWMICDDRDYPHLQWEGVECQPYSDVVYVDSTATGGNSGSSWENAFTSLQDAMTMVTAGTEIRVAQGTHKPDQFNLLDRVSRGRMETYALKSGVILKGGYRGNSNSIPPLSNFKSQISNPPSPDDRDPAKYPTILSGDLSGNDNPNTSLNALRADPTRADNSYHVLTAVGVDNTVLLDGFTITGGHANSATAPDYRGAGIYLEQSSPTISNCIFTRNAAFNGGALANYDQGNLAITDCRFTANAAYNGGAVINETPGSFGRCVFAGNFASYGGAICVANQTTLTNCTLADNAAARSGGGIYSAPAGKYTVANCILWDNKTRGVADKAAQITGGKPIVYYSTIQDWYGLDPLFADPSAGDYRLKSTAGRWDPLAADWVLDDVTSPAIDAGSPFDPVGDEPAPNGGRINQGFDGGTAFASKSPAPDNIADLNHDRVVNILDLAIVAENWLK